MVIPVIPTARINAGGIPTIVNMIVSVIPVIEKRTAIMA